MAFQCQFQHYAISENTFTILYDWIFTWNAKQSGFLRFLPMQTKVYVAALVAVQFQFQVWVQV